MKRGALIFLLMILSMSMALWAVEEKDTRHLAVDAGLMVFDRQKAADKLAEWAENNGGYFIWKSDESVRLRVPDKAVEELRSYLEQIGDGLLSYGRSSNDLREAMIRSRSALEAREEILVKNLAMINSSNVEGTLSLEREIRRLMREIDSSRGMLNKLENDCLMAMVNVRLSFNQQTVAADRPSRFDWINTVDFYQFVNRPDYGGGRKLFPPKPVPVPEGFARVTDAKDFVALSPKGLMVRVREVPNYPEQSMEFWRETLKNDLENRGYLSVSHEETMDWGGDGLFHTCLWALPLGTEDYLYITGIRLKGKKLQILEMAGKAEYMDEYLK